MDYLFIIMLFLMGFITLESKEYSFRGIVLDLSNDSQYIYFSLIYFILALFLIYLNISRKKKL
jgi:hypothetical protein